MYSLIIYSLLSHSVSIFHSCWLNHVNQKKQPTMNSQFTIISTPYVLLKSQIPAGEPFPASELVAKGPAVVYAIRRPG
jgi:hypothetical protein